MKKRTWKTFKEICNELLPPQDEPLILEKFLSIRETAIALCELFAPKWYKDTVLYGEAANNRMYLEALKGGLDPSCFERNIPAALVNQQGN